MSSYAELTDTATTRLLETVQPVEDVTVKLVGAVDGVVRKLPTLPRPAAVPTTLEVVDAGFAVAERLLTAQKGFLLRVLSGDAAAPLVPQQGEPIAAPTSTKV